MTGIRVPEFSTGTHSYMHEYGLEKGMQDGKVLQSLGEPNPYWLVRHIANGL